MFPASPPVDVLADAFANPETIFRNHLLEETEPDT
jgi:hypothetical protein